MNKIYEFRYIDKLNLSESEILSTIEEILISEASFQGWQLGYNFRHSQINTQHKTSDERIYFCEVFGQFIDQESFDYNEELERILEGKEE